MNERLALAIRNNNDLYKAIFTPHGIESQLNDSIWYCLEKTPPLYSNLVTLSKNWMPDQIFDSINAQFEYKQWNDWSIKDSFNALKLINYGFKKLFVAQWIYLEASRFKPKKLERSLRYEIVENEDQLSDWRIAWDSDEQLGREIFKTELLADPKIRFVAGYEEKDIVNGCLLNRTEDVLGISNFFSSGERVDYWTGLVGFVLSKFEHCDLVGYERINVVEFVSKLGFKSIGDLSVWLKRASISGS